MAINEVSYPVTGGEGNYSNIFPSQKPLYANFSRVDAVINSIVSGDDGVIRAEISSDTSLLSVGDFVDWGADVYGLNTSRISAIINSSTIELNQPFTSTNVDNGFLNFKKNYVLEVRYVSDGSTSNNQSATELNISRSRFTNNKAGEIIANIAYPSVLLKPDIFLETGVNDTMFIEYKIQYRESWEGNRNEAWKSPSEDIKIMLVFSSKDISRNQFIDTSVSKKFVTGYPVIYSFNYSDVNDNGLNEFFISLVQYALNKTVIRTDLITSVLNLKGVYTVYIDTNDLDISTSFIEIKYTKTASSKQFDPTQFDPTQFA